MFGKFIVYGNISYIEIGGVGYGIMWDKGYSYMIDLETEKNLAFHYGIYN